MTIICCKKHKSAIEKEIAAIPKANPLETPMGFIGLFTGIPLPINFIVRPYLKKIRIVDESQFKWQMTMPLLDIVQNSEVLDEARARLISQNIRRLI